jgi:hypothetical protein
MDFLMIFSDFEAFFDKHSGLRVQKRTKKYGKRAKKPLLGLVLTGPSLYCIIFKQIAMF